MVFAFRLLVLSALIISVASQCPAQCQGCGTTIVECTTTTLLDISRIQTQDLRIQCLENGGLDTNGLKDMDGLRQLTIHGCLQGSIPADTFKSLQNLEYLNISQNNIESVHKDSFGTLENLITLDISYNNIQTVPEGLLSRTRKLELFYMDHNRLNILPKHLLADLRSLTELGLSTNNLVNISDCFEGLEKLRTIDLSYNKLTELSGSDFALPLLQSLDLSYNRIELIQNEVLPAENLATLNLAGNRLTEVDLVYLPSVTDLNLSENRIQSLPLSFSQMLQNVNHVDLSGNPLHCNCDLEHLRVYFLNNGDRLEPMECVTPKSLSFSTATSPFQCTEPSIKITQDGSGLSCTVTGDPPPEVTWYDAQSGESLMTSSPTDDVSAGSNGAKLGEDLLESRSELLCSAVNTAGTKEEKCFVFQLRTNSTTDKNDSGDTVSLGLFIGCMIGVTVGTLCFVIYVALCCKFCTCRKKQKEDQYHRSQVPYTQRPYYAQPQKSRKKRKHTSRPWEFPPQYPAQYSTAPQPSTAPSENIYATIPEGRERGTRPETQQGTQYEPQPETLPEHPVAMIEELPSDDDDIKPAMIDTPETVPKTQRIIELGDTPSTSTTNIPTPAQSTDPLPAYASNPALSQSPPLRLYSASNPDFSASSSPLSPPQPSVFAVNRRASDRVGFFSGSAPNSSRSSSMIITGELFVDPRPFQGINMERTWSEEFGNEINV